MSELNTNSKSPRGLFEIHKKEKKKASRRRSEKVFKHTEEHIMKELIRLSYKNDMGKLLALKLETQRSSKAKRKKYKMYAAEMKQNFIEIVKILIIKKMPPSLVYPI